MYESTKITLLTSVILLAFFDGSALADVVASSVALFLLVLVNSENGALKASFSFWSCSFLSLSSALASDSSEGPDSLSYSWLSLARTSCLVGLAGLAAFSEFSSTAADVMDW
jgi:hypothetical protein